MIGIGTRWSDFTTASKSAFQDPGVRFVNVNVAAFDAGKQSGLPVVADARVALEQLRDALAGRASIRRGSDRARRGGGDVGGEVTRLVSPDGDHRRPTVARHKSSKKSTTRPARPA